MQLANLRLHRQQSDPELSSYSIKTRNIANNIDLTRVWQDDRNGQELDQSDADSRVHVLALKYEKNDNINDNILKERSLEITKIFDVTSQEKEAPKNKKLIIGNWRDPIHKSTIQTRRTSHHVALQVEEQGSGQWTLEQVDQNQQERDTRYNLEDQQVSPQSAIALHETQQVDNNPDRCFEFRQGGNTNQREQ
ncbi:MAG: hypothetical protein EZS28_004650 [Streblomastix strix]|uniref:Uncharacterized protein n=1 Tax=Streblomastix strix TaxID=222440 RepID=A0A5J4WYD0_9EUKA|nr:MAG: hypothetical protein EZS28_004650 [Streblomastix strix]